MDMITGLPKLKEFSEFNKEFQFPTYDEFVKNMQTSYTDLTDNTTDKLNE